MSDDYEADYRLFCCNMSGVGDGLAYHNYLEARLRATEIERDTARNDQDAAESVLETGVNLFKRLLELRAVEEAARKIVIASKRLIDLPLPAVEADVMLVFLDALQLLENSLALIPPKENATEDTDVHDP